VSIEIGKRNINSKSQSSNLSVIVKIGNLGELPRAAASGMLDDESAVISAYQDWQTSYRRQLGLDTRIDIPADQITHLEQLPLSIDSRNERLCQRDVEGIETCKIAAENLQRILNQWLDRADFQPIKELMLQELHPSQSIQVIIQTDELHLRQLPFQLWNFFDRFSHAEISIASNNYQSIVKEQFVGVDLNILAIFGNSTGIDLEVDRHSLSALPNATVEFLLEPTRQTLTDKLWEKSWDIIFFGGHSASIPSLTSGYLKINQLDRLNISELKYALKKSIESGLKLVILNSCDGLGLAAELISIQLPQAIVMREPVPDFIAQQFLKNLLAAFATGLPLYRSVRSAREQLQGLEDRYPCASWLPIIRLK
jgi:hypothetical protein